MIQPITHKLLVTGSHEWDDLAVLQYELNEVLTEWRASARQVLLIEGECHAGGADIMARDTWWSLGGPVLGVPANWKALGKRAGVCPQPAHGRHDARSGAGVPRRRQPGYEGLPGTCAGCGHSDGCRAMTQPSTHIYPAPWFGYCDTCGREVARGDRILRSGHQGRTWEHERCYFK
ncbi:hypothetical protein K8O93_00740 [Gordonia bronchialis]|uniref:hypothetical protein n=1 Tax=Gordonia bronchialis TaxID=2054 RepID=UPI001CC0BB22|nr:hypothetical protein [Gordonia bronchialis]UAK38360.1 hypothetical protein K8O93_00740 [Gordonia bronchialis]